MGRKFKSQEEAKAWGQQMMLARARAREEKLKKQAEAKQKEEEFQKEEEKRIQEVLGETPQETPQEVPQNPEPEPVLPQVPGRVWIKHQSGDILSVEPWLAQDLVQKGEAQYL